MWRREERVACGGRGEARWEVAQSALTTEAHAPTALPCETVAQVPASWGQSRFAGLRAAMSPAYTQMIDAGVRFVASSDSGAIPNVFHHQACHSSNGCNSAHRRSLPP